MFARHVSMHLKPNTRAEFTQTIENEILPRLGNSTASRTKSSSSPRDLERKGSLSVFGTRKRTRKPISAAAIQKC